MKKILGKIYLLLAFFLAGTSVITGHILAEKLGSFTITAVSLVIPLICLAPFFGIRTVQTIRRLKRNDWQMLILQAVFGIFLFRAFLLFGVDSTSAVEAGILTGTTPAITAILAFFYLREKISGPAALGIACTVFGIVLLQGNNLNAVRFSLQHIFGNLLVLCAAASESIFNILSRKQRKRKQLDTEEIHPMVQTLLVSAIAFALSFIPALGEEPISALKTIGLREWLALAWYGLIVTALGFVFFYEGVKRCSAYITAAFSGMIPLTSVLLSLLLLKEKIGYSECAGGFLIITGMLLIGRKETAEITDALKSSLPQTENTY